MPEINLAHGTRLGPYEILAPLGAGGMGKVYRPRKQALGRNDAITLQFTRVSPVRPVVMCDRSLIGAVHD